MGLRIADLDSVDGDVQPGAADGLSWPAKNPLHQGHAARQVTAPAEEARDRLRRRHGDEFGVVEGANRPQGVEPDWHARAGVPDQLRRWVHEGGARGRHRRKIGRHDPAEARHGCALRRRSQALCCARV